jgi:VanZ family protein
VTSDSLSDPRNGGPPLRLVRLWGPVIVYAAVIFVASSMSQPPALPEGVSDKHVHAGLYAGFTLVILRALTGARLRRVTLLSACVAIVLAVLYGVSDEFHQSFVPNRTADIADVAADATGAAAAASLTWLLARLGLGRAGARI